MGICASDGYHLSIRIVDISDVPATIDNVKVQVSLADQTETTPRGHHKDNKYMWSHSPWVMKGYDFHHDSLAVKLLGLRNEPYHVKVEDLDLSDDELTLVSLSIDEHTLILEVHLTSSAEAIPQLSSPTIHLHSRSTVMARTSPAARVLNWWPQPPAKAFQPQDLRIWAGTICIDSELPSSVITRHLLYDDPNNSAQDADVIALFIRGIRIDSLTSMQVLRHWFSRVVLDNSNYIFNEEDEGLPYANFPGLPVVTPAGTFVALYCCVHKRCIGSDPNHAQPSEIFPLPVRLTCRVQPQVGSKRPKIPGVEHYILVQDVVLGINGVFMVLKLMGAHLDPSPSARLLQLRELERDFLAWERDGQRFAGVLFGDLASQIVVPPSYEDMLNSEMEAAEQSLSRHMSMWLVRRSSTWGARRPSLWAGNCSRRLSPNSPSNNQSNGEEICSLCDDGVDMLCNAMATPEGRRELFQYNTMSFIGEDVFGTVHSSLDEPTQKLRSLFKLYTDFVEEHPDFALPLPTFKRRPVKALLTDGLGFPVKTEGLVLWEQLERARRCLPEVEFAMDMGEAYAAKAQLQTKFSPALQMQCGWLDGVGVYKKGSVAAKLVRFDADTSIMAFDHVPVKGMVHVTPPAGGPPVKVWVGAIKLDNRFPESNAIREFLYDNPEVSADGADVIALYLTDLHLNINNVDAVRQLMRRNVRRPEEYMFSEEDPSIGVRHIPTILVKVKEADPRYVALFVGVRRTLVGDFDGNSVPSIQDVFHLPASLMCRSHLKNELAPNFKAHMVQDVVLYRNEQYFRLMLFGLNFDTYVDAQLCQVESMERCMNACRMNQLPFTAIIFGDFNNRLVCPEEYKDDIIVLEKVGDDGKLKLQLGPNAVQDLNRRLADPELRRKLYIEQDSWSWSGEDALENVISSPPRCFQKLSEMFETQRDLFLADESLPIPPPTYKRTPVNVLLGKHAGFTLEVNSLITMSRLHDAFRDLVLPTPPSRVMTPTAVRRLLFSDEVSPTVDAKTQPYAVFELGWPDGVGIFKGPLSGYIKAWDVAEEFVGSEHAPTRGTVIITLKA